IFTVVVTYRRPDTLELCLNSIFDQVNSEIHELYIVVNSDDPETLVVVEKFKKKYENKITYEVFDNCGPAGGFHIGLKKFLDSECNYVWLMDDDIIADEHCLNHLMQFRCTGYVFAKVMDIEDNPI